LFKAVSVYQWINRTDIEELSVIETRDNKERETKNNQQTEKDKQTIHCSTITIPIAHTLSFCSATISTCTHTLASNIGFSSGPCTTFSCLLHIVISCCLKYLLSSSSTNTRLRKYFTLNLL